MKIHFKKDTIKKMLRLCNSIFTNNKLVSAKLEEEIVIFFLFKLNYKILRALDFSLRLGHYCNTV